MHSYCEYLLTIQSRMKFKKQSLDYVSTGGTIAEEAFTSVRIVQSFGIQYHLARLYAGINDKTAVIGRKSALVNAIGLACFFSVRLHSHEED